MFKLIILGASLIMCSLGVGLSLYVMFKDLNASCRVFRKSKAVVDFGISCDGPVFGRFILSSWVSGLIVSPDGQIRLGRLDPAELEQIPGEIRIRAVLSSWMVYASLNATLMVFLYLKSLDWLLECFK